MSMTYDITQGSPNTVYSLGDSQTTYTLANAVSVSSSGATITGIGVPWITTTGSGTSITADPSWQHGTSSKIRLDGPEADIEINGESLVNMLKQIEQRLNILTPNPKLESEWEELKALGDQYRKLEAQIQAKMKTWELLNK